MKPIKFKEHNITFFRHHPSQFPVPAHKTAKGLVISCWRVTRLERLRMLFTGRLYLCVQTFNRPLQQQLPMAESPFVKEK